MRECKHYSFLLPFSRVFCSVSHNVEDSWAQVKCCFKEITSLEKKREFVRSCLIQLSPGGTHFFLLPSPLSPSEWIAMMAHCLHQELCQTDKVKYVDTGQFVTLCLPNLRSRGGRR